jgi:ATP synthase protein I
MEVAMAGTNGPGETGRSGPGRQAGADPRDDDLERRRRLLEASLATRQPERQERSGGTGAAAGYGQAMKLSSEFIAGIAVGAGLGWLIDRFAGSSPWGLIVFLLLGFVAGVLNVLRSVGKVAEFGQGANRGPDDEHRH